MPSRSFTPPRDYFFDFFPSQANGTSWLDWTAAWLTLGLGSLASQDIFQRANSARSEKVAVYSTLFGACLYLVFAMAPLYLALLVFQLEPTLLAGDTQYALLQLVGGHAPFWLQVCFYGALLSAVFSTCSGALLAPSSILAENFFRPLFLREADDRHHRGEPPEVVETEQTGRCDGPEDAERHREVEPGRGREPAPEDVRGHRDGSV